MLRNALAALKWSAVNFGLLWRNRKQRRHVPGNGPVVFVDLQENPYERYLVLLLLMFRNAGHRIAFRPHAGMLTSWSTTLLQQRFPEAPWCTGPPKDTVLVLSDRPGPAPRGVPVRLLDADYFAPPAPSTWRVPMPMVDSVYVYQCEEPRKPPTDDPLQGMGRIRIYYSGGFDPKHYDNPVLHDTFGCLSRQRMNKVLHEHFAPLIEHPKDKSALTHSDKPICIIDRHKDFYVDPIDLRWILAHTDFLPAFPGVVMPWTHSIVEGMSLGAVPILQFPELFDPPLRDGVDCLRFPDEAGFVSALERALAMPRHEVDRMRAATKEYYERYMAPQVVIARLLDPAGPRHVALMAEWHSVRLLMDRRAGKRTR